MEKVIFEKLKGSPLTFMVSMLDDMPYLFFAQKLEVLKINGKEFLAFPSSDRNLAISLSSDPRVFGLALFTKEKKIIRFTGKGLAGKEKEILQKFDKEEPGNFAVMLKIENLKEESIE
ncbi:MAG: hypothetical protein ACUVUG_09025 [Candidatus Aminicenantia bacterium]